MESSRRTAALLALLVAGLLTGSPASAAGDLFKDTVGALQVVKMRLGAVQGSAERAGLATTDR